MRKCLFFFYPLLWKFFNWQRNIFQLDIDQQERDSPSYHLRMSGLQQMSGLHRASGASRPHSLGSAPFRALLWKGLKQCCY